MNKKVSRIEAQMHSYAFCGLNEGDPRASSKGREGIETIPFGDVCYYFWSWVIVGERLEENETSFNKGVACSIVT